MSNLSEPPEIRDAQGLKLIRRALVKIANIYMPGFHTPYDDMTEENAWLRRNWVVLFSFEQCEKIIAAYVAALLS